MVGYNHRSLYLYNMLLVIRCGGGVQAELVGLDDPGLHHLVPGGRLHLLHAVWNLLLHYEVPLLLLPLNVI